MNQTAEDEWHLMIQARPADTCAGPTLTIRDTEILTLDLSGRPTAEPLAARFETVLSALERLGMFVEPDGSFCWTAPGAIWRIYGEIYDGRETVQYVELKGCCPEAEFRQLLACMCNEKLSQIMVQLVREGVFVEAEAFAEFAFGNVGP